MEKIVQFLADFLLEGFLLSTPFFSLLYFIRPKHRELIIQFFERSNGLLILYGMVVLYAFFKDVVMTFKFENHYAYHAYVNRLYGPNWYMFWGPIVVQGLLPQLFWIKQVRQKMAASIILMVLLILSYYLPVLQSMQQDYLASSWQLNLDFTRMVLSFFIYSPLVMGREITQVWN